MRCREIKPSVEAQIHNTGRKMTSVLRAASAALLCVLSSCATRAALSWAIIEPNTPIDSVSRLPTSVIDRKTGIGLRLVRPGERTEGKFRVLNRKPFYIGVHEVTEAEWSRVFRNRGGFSRSDRLMTDAQPEHVEQFLRRTGLRLPTRAEFDYVSVLVRSQSSHAQGVLDYEWHNNRQGFWSASVSDFTTGVLGRLPELVANDKDTGISCDQLCHRFFATLGRPGPVGFRVARDP